VATYSDTRLPSPIRARKIVRGLKQGLTDEDRFAVADDVVSQLKQGRGANVTAL